MERIQEQGRIREKRIELPACRGGLGFQSLHGALEEPMERLHDGRRLNPELNQSIAENGTLLNHVRLKRFEPRRATRLCAQRLAGHREIPQSQNQTPLLQSNPEIYSTSREPLHSGKKTPLRSPKLYDEPLQHLPRKCETAELHLFHFLNGNLHPIPLPIFLLFFQERAQPLRILARLGDEEAGVIEQNIGPLRGNQRQEKWPIQKPQVLPQLGPQLSFQRGHDFPVELLQTVTPERPKLGRLSQPPPG